MRDAIKDAQGPHSDALREAIREIISGTQGHQSDLALVRMVHDVAISGHPWPSVATLSGTQWHSMALSGTQWQ